MSTLKKLFDCVWLTATHLRKKAYTAGLVALSGVAAIAFMFIGVNGFSSATTSIALSTVYEVEEDDSGEDVTLELLTEETSSEESLPEHLVWAMANYEQMYASIEDAKVAEAGSETLAREPETEKVLKTASENSDTEEEDAPESALSVKDYTALIRIVEAEATDEDLIGKILIANVVLNRVASSRFPDTIYEVVHQSIGGKAQFSPIDDGRYYTVSITDSTEEAVVAALDGVDYSEGAMFFVAKSLASESAGSWFDRNLTFIMKHGVHSFYKY